MKDQKHKSPAEELRDIAPGLPPSPVHDGFTVPEGYFESLPQRVLSAIADDRLRQKRRHRIIYKYAAAAAIIFTLLIAGMWYATQAVHEPDALAAIEWEDLYLYAVEHADEFTSDDLLAIGFSSDRGMAESLWVSDLYIEALLDDYPDTHDIIDEILIDVIYY